MLNMLAVEKIVKNALEEDLGNGDITSFALFSPKNYGRGEIICRQKGIIAGLHVAGTVFKMVTPGCDYEMLVDDGSAVDKGKKVAVIEGPITSILGAERVALNFLQRMSGIATLTSQYVAKVKPYKAKICDTRKTVPGLRFLDKYAVRTGGGVNHRFNLGDAVLIKDNHIKSSGGISEAVKIIRRNVPLTSKIEVEVENFEQLMEALAVGVDLIMLDNMTLEEMRQAVIEVKGRALVEASGGITLEQVESVASTGVDYISIGALTHSVSALDISLEIC